MKVFSGRFFFIFFPLLFGIAGIARGQNKTLDSLNTALKHHQAEDSIRVNLLNELATNYFEYDVYKLGEVSKLALALSRKLQYSKGEATAYLNMGTWFTLLKGDTAALNYLNKAEHMFSRQADGNGITRTLNMKGCYYATLKDHLRARGYFLRALQANSDGNTWQRLAILNNLASNREDTGHDTDALKLYREVLALATRVHNHLYVSASYQNIASIYLKRHNYTAALAYSRIGMAYTLLHQSGPRSEQYQQLLFGDIYRHTGHLDSARIAYQQVIALAKAMRSSENKVAAYWGLYQLDSAQHNAQGAMLHYRLHAALKDSVLNAENYRVAALYDIKYKMAEQERLNQQLQLQNTRKQMVINMQRWLLGVCLLLVLATAGILTYRHHMYRRLKATNETIAAQKALLEESDKTKDQLFSVIAHDLRSPMAQVVNILDLLENEYLTPQEAAELIPQAKKNTKNAMATMDNLLVWSKNQLHGFTFNPEVLSLHTIAAEKVRKLETLAKTKSINLVNEVPIGMHVFADKEMVTIIFRNLLNNAIKFTPENGQVTISCTVNAGMVTTAIADNGVGMSAERLAGLFSAGMLSTPGTAQEKGTGLGLKLCRDFAVLNGGELRAKSVEGAGSVFSFTLPRYQS